MRKEFKVKLTPDEMATLVKLCVIGTKCAADNYEFANNSTAIFYKFASNLDVKLQLELTAEFKRMCETEQCK